MNPQALSLIGPHQGAESKAGAVVANWHDEAHAGAFSMCQEQPCLAVREAERT